MSSVFCRHAGGTNFTLTRTPEHVACIPTVLACCTLTLLTLQGDDTECRGPYAWMTAPRPWTVWRDQSLFFAMSFLMLRIRRLLIKHGFPDGFQRPTGSLIITNHRIVLSLSALSHSLSALSLSQLSLRSLSLALTYPPLSLSLSSTSLSSIPLRLSHLFLPSPLSLSLSSLSSPN